MVVHERSPTDHSSTIAECSETSNERRKAQCAPDISHTKDISVTIRSWKVLKKINFFIMMHLVTKYYLVNVQDRTFFSNCNFLVVIVMNRKFVM